MTAQERLLMLLPGPPYELKALFETECMPRLRARIPPQHIATRTLKMAMMPESQVDARVAPIYKTYADVETTILAGAGEIQLHLRCRKDSQAEAEARVEELAEKIEDELGDAIFSRKGETIEQIVSYLLQMRGMTLAVAESCTGGLLAERITSLSGSSRYFLGGAVVYSNELKTQFANVPKALIDQHGAVSREVAAAMAEGIRKRCLASYGVGITGVAGPTRRHRAEARGPGLHRARGRRRHAGRRAEFSRRPRAHPPVRNPAGAGDDSPGAVVGRYNLNWWSDGVRDRSGGEPSTRLCTRCEYFIGIDLDSEVRERIARFLEGVEGFAPEARWVRPESLHITLKFIGEQTPDQVAGHHRTFAAGRGQRVRNSLRRIRILPYRKGSARILDRNSGRTATGRTG